MKKRNVRLLAPVLLLALLMPSAGAADTAEITECRADGSGVTLEWTDCGADRYEVYRSSREHGTYVRIAVTPSSTYRDTGIRPGQVFFYQVRPRWDSPGGTRYGPFSAPAGQCGVRLVSAPATANPCWQQGRTIRVTGLMLHSVGCAQESGAVFASVWNQPEADVLVHAVIEPGGTVYQLADWERRCWHCGGSGNDYLIGVEMTEPNELVYTSGTEFIWSGRAREKAIDNYNTAVSLFASLCFQYDLDPMTAILSHKEGGERGIASGHGDPEHLWTGLGLNLTMDTFRQDVRKKMAGSYRDRTVADSASPAATVTADVLNVRSGPGMAYDVLGVLEQGSGVAVLEVRQTADRIWGRLASGGWVCMDYVG